MNYANFLRVILYFWGISLCVFVAFHFVFLWYFTLCFWGIFVCIFGVFHNVYSQKQPLILYKNKQKLFCQQISVNITLIGKLPILPFSITKNQIRFYIAEGIRFHLLHIE